MKIQPWNVLQSKVVYETPWIQVIEEICEHNGQQLTYTSVRRRDEGPQIIAEDEGKLWLVQQYRHPTRQILWQFPAEGKKENESWADAAQRGVEEELGKHAEELIDLGEFFVDPGLLTQKSHFFLARNLHDIPAKKKHHLSEQEVEELNTQKFSLTEIDMMITRGEIRDNWTLAGLEIYQRFLSKK